MAKEKITIGGIIGAVIIILVGIMVMSDLCPRVLENVKNNPQAVDSASRVCSIFFQNAPNLIPSP